MTPILRNTQKEVNAHFAYHAMAARGGPCDLRGMHTRLKEHRKRAKLTLEQMAEKAGVSVSQLSRWESGGNNIPSERLPQLARAYGCSVGEIFDEIAPVPNEDELAEMIGEAMDELPVGIGFADYPQAVASGLRERLKQFRAAAAVPNLVRERPAPGKSARSPAPTKEGEQAKSRTA